MAILDKFSRLKIGTKILIICLVLVIVPTLLLGLVAYTSSSNAISGQIDTLLSTEINDIRKMTANTYELAQTKVNGDLNVLRSTFYGYGTPEISGGKLVLKGQGGQSYVVNDNFEIVDQIEKMTGSKATIFQKTDGQAIRISTNVVGADGKRAIGTPVSDAVYDVVISRGETYYGTADVVGKTYISAYEPIKSASGEIIGILFVGVPEDTVYGGLKKEILGVKLGENGYVYVVDSKGTLLVHPSLQGQNLADEGFIQEMIANKDKVRDKAEKSNTYGRARTPRHTIPTSLHSIGSSPRMSTLPISWARSTEYGMLSSSSSWQALPSVPSSLSCSADPSPAGWETLSPWATR